MDKNNMDKNDRKQIYKHVSHKNYEKQESAISTMSKNIICNYLEEIIFLTNNIPNWDIYLNEKQVKILKLFITYKNISDTAILMNLPYGTIYSALFGSSIKDEQGIYGKLKKIYSVINENNKNVNSLGKVIIEHNETIKKNRNNNIDHKEQLYKFVDAIPNWKDYLTNSQIEVLELYIEHKSCSKVDEILGKNSTWSILYGKTKLNPKGIYGKLEKIYRENVK